MISSDAVEKETYAKIVSNYLLSHEERPLRFVLMGFNEIRDLLRNELGKNRVLVIEPEVSGRLREASVLRGKSEEDCVILISRMNVGKFASLITAFKVLEEVINSQGFREDGDAYNLNSVSKWLIQKGLGNITAILVDTHQISISPLNFDGVQFILKEIWRISEQKPSYAIWLHPRKISKAMVAILSSCKEHRQTSVAFFLRSLGIESNSALENVSLFSNDIMIEENSASLKSTLKDYGRVVNYLIASDITSQRRYLAGICFNHLRIMISELARNEIELSAKGSWKDIFCDFEYAFTEKAKIYKKYQIIPQGVKIRERSPISGLPKRFLVPIKVFLRPENKRNLLKEFMVSTLNDVAKEYVKTGKMTTLIAPISLSKPKTELIVECTIIENANCLPLDTYMTGLKNPSSKINRLIALAFKEKVANV